MELAQRIEHTLLKPEATVKDIMRLCMKRSSIIFMPYA